MWKIIGFCYKNALLVLGILCALTIGLGYFAAQIELDVSIDTLVPKGDKASLVYEDVRATFGSDHIASVYIQDAQLFTPAKMKKLQALHERLASLDKIERVESLFNITHIKDRQGYLNTGPLLEQVPEDQAELDSLKQEAVNNLLLKRTVISEDGSATLITLYLEGTKKGKELAFDRSVYKTIETVIGEFGESFDDIYQIGTPSLQMRMSEFLKTDQGFLLPLAALFLVSIIGLTLQSFHGSLIPIANALMSTVWTMGIMVLLGIPLNMLNYVVPALIIIVGATEDVHFFAEFLEKSGEGHDKFSAVVMAGHRIGLPILLTAVTTILGFSAIGLTSIPLMQQFAVSAGLGMATRFATTTLFTPAYISLLVNPSKQAGKHAHRPAWSEKLAEKFTLFVMNKLAPNPVPVTGICLLLSIGGIFMATKIELNNDLLSFLKPTSKIKQEITQASEMLSGSKVIYLTLEGNKNDFLTYSTLERLENLTKALREYKEFDTVTSLSDMICLVNQEMNDGDKRNFRVPENENLISQYLLFFHTSDVERYINHDYSRANIMIRTHVSSSTELNTLITDLKTRLDSGGFGPLIYTITGKSVLVANAVDRIAKGQALSIGSIAIVLFIIVAALFVSAKCGFLSVISNLFYIIMLFGIMGLFGFPLNVGTCMVAAITVGIGIDDTLHLMVRYNQELKHHKNEITAIAFTLRSEFLPVIVTSIGLAGGFLILSLSSFLPVQQFGLLSALVIILAVVADLMLTPVLLAHTRLITLWDLLGFKLRERLRETSEFFQGLTSWQAKKVILLSNLTGYEAGELVIKDGDVGDTMYVIIEGVLEVTKVIDEERVHIADLTDGDIIGEIALISQSQRTADVVAKTDTKLLALNWESFEKIQRVAPGLASKIYLNMARILGKRLVTTTAKSKG